MADWLAGQLRSSMLLAGYFGRLRPALPVLADTWWLYFCRDSAVWGLA